LEIYNEEIHDLLSKSSKTKLDIKESKEQGFYVKDLSTFVVKGIDEMKEVMTAGQRNRHTGETLMNRDSSRSHSIFQVALETSEVDSAGL
jgi:kinesin family protein 3/17